MGGNLLTTIGGFALVLLAVAAIPLVGARLRLPAATLQATLGIALGAAVLWLADDPGPLLAPLRAVLDTISGVGAQGILALFLPPLLFDAALRVDTRRLVGDLAPVLLLAVVAVVLTTALVAVGAVAAIGLPWLWAILLGALVSTTDPSAVLGAFRQVGAPRRLQALIEGESLLNDAAAIVLFVAVVEMLRGAAVPSAGALGLDFALTFLGGALLGAALGELAGRLVARVREVPDVAITVSLALPYLVFVVAEQYLGVSGVVAVVLAGLALGRALERRTPPALGRQVLQLWGQLANWAGALIVIGATLLIPVTLRPDLIDVGDVVAVVVACLVARALVLYGLVPLLTMLGLAAPIGGSYRLAMLWGGLRGAVTVALALTVASDPTLPAPLSDQVAVAAAALVVFTLFVQAPTLPLVLRALGLGGLSRLDRVLQERAGRAVAQRLRERITELRVALGLDVPDEAAVVPVTLDETGTATVERRDRILAAIASITEREAGRYRDLYDEGLVGRQAAPSLLRGPLLLTEALRSDGLAAYATAAKRELAYSRELRLWLQLYRRLGLRRPLSRALALRYELILIRRAVLTRLRRDAVEEVATLFDEDAATRVDTLLNARLEGHQRALEGLRRQYPGYARELETRFLRRAGLRLEAQAYRELLDDGLLSGAAFAELRRQVDVRRRATERLPALDLRVNRRDLIERVALFTDLAPRTRRRLARALRPGFAVPGDRIIRRGDWAEAMFFIADGAVAVQWPGGRRTLGTGEVFGEIALLKGGRRTADVVALTYLSYLRLGRDDFFRLARSERGLRDRVDALARARAAEQRTSDVSRETPAA